MGKKSLFGDSDDIFTKNSDFHIEFEENHIATVEGCKGIIEYDRNTVRLNCSKLTVKFTGEDLSIRAITTEHINVYGIIMSVDFGG